MRASANPKDRAYLGKDCLIKAYLDGVEINDVVTADEEEGYILRYIPRDECPAVVLEAMGDAPQLLKQELYGKVRVKIEPPDWVKTISDCLDRFDDKEVLANYGGKGASHLSASEAKIVYADDSRREYTVTTHVIGRKYLLRRAVIHWISGQTILRQP